MSSVKALICILYENHQNGKTHNEENAHSPGMNDTSHRTTGARNKAGM